MARRPKIYLKSPLDLPQRPRAPESIPYPIVKGLVHALLTHLWDEHRRKRGEQAAYPDEMERAILTYIEQAVRYGGNLSEEEIVSKLTEDIPVLFEQYIGHHPRLFIQQSDFIVGIATGIKPAYASLKHLKDRIAWIKTHLSDCLTHLERHAPCAECRMNTALPTDSAVLTQWASEIGLGELRLHLLSYFHNGTVTPSTVKRLLASSGINTR